LTDSNDHFTIDQPTSSTEGATGHRNANSDDRRTQESMIVHINHRRLHGEITDDNSYVTPAEFEATYYRQAAPALAAVTQTSE
jgi:hypothetical protein